MILLLALLGLLQVSTTPAPRPDGIDRISAQLLDLHLDTSQIYAVQDVTIERDAVSLSFTEGAIAFFEPVRGRITGAVFVGSGSVDVRLPDDVERGQLRGFTGSTSLDEAFGMAILRFTDYTPEEILRQVEETPGNVSSGDRAALMSWEADPEWLAAYRDRILTDLVGSGERPFFLAAIDGLSYGRLNVVYDERAPEQVMVYAADPVSPGWINVWTSFDRLGPSAGPATDVRPFDVVSYAIDVRLSADPDAGIAARTVATLRFQWPEERTAKFELNPALRVRAVRVNGEPAEFLQAAAPDPGDENRLLASGPLLVLLPPLPANAPSPGDEWEIEFEYEGPALMHLGDSMFYTDERTLWYPRPDWQDPAVFDMTFRDPEFPDPGSPDPDPALGTADSVLRGTSLVATGQRESILVGRSGSREVWSSDGNLFAAGFAYGRFHVEGGGSSYGPVVASAWVDDDVQALYEELRSAVTADSEALDSAFGTAIGEGNPEGLTVAESRLYDPARLGQSILSEVGGQLEIFVDRFGRYPFSHLSVLQLPVDFIEGQGSLLNVSTLPFFNAVETGRIGLAGALDPDSAELARALRIGSQWFGNAIGWQSYRDRWLISGLAGYSGVVYLDDRYPGAGRGSAMLRSLRDVLLAPAGITTTHENQGPVWLGTRLANRQTPNAYAETVYPKSVWIIHMLRMLMRAPDARDPDSAFFEMIRDLLDTYDGRTVTTREFETMVERHMPDSMDLDGTGSLDWFFDEWVRSTGIPEYAVDFVVEQRGRSYRVSGRIRQRGVAEFIMPVPLYARSGVGSETYLGTVVVDGDGGEFRYDLPTLPVSLEIDPYDTVLKR